MENNHVFLEFDHMTTRLAGFDYGKEIYSDQVQSKIDFTKAATIEFPEQIIKIASSFVQGFFESIVDLVGLEEIGKKVTVVTGSEELTNSIYDNLT